ncbi:MAG: TerB family tellurite resistance protein [Spirochaetaceae bacterium]|nr:TerB family tellurite resistance protein [Spirochaetaceae bacterium]
MGWFGKLIGGTTGFFIGGPIGAVLGAVIGHSFDKRAELLGTGNRQKNYSNWNRGTSQTFSTNDQSQMIFFVATFSMLGKMAGADGTVSNVEIRTIEEFIDNNLRLNITEKQFAMRIVNTSAASNEPFDKFAQQFYSLFYNQPQMLRTMYDILYKVAAADNQLTKDEEKILDSATRIFNLKNKESASSYSSTISSDKNYTVLDCKKTDSNDTIKAAYKKLVKDYHPDAIASKGLPEEFTKFASQKFREINQAYEEIRKERNF